MTVNYTENENKDKIRKKAENINSNKNRKNKRNLNEVKKGEKEKSIRIYSYNSRGFDMIKQKVCMELSSLDKSRRNIICNQERPGEKWAHYSSGPSRSSRIYKTCYKRQT